MNGMGPVGQTGTLVDLFSGCGGFSLGAELAGFRSLAAIDVDATLQSGYRRNFPHTRTIHADIRDLEGSDWQVLLGGKVRPDGVIGGPPCQGFSAIGKRVVGDPRNSLVFEFVRQVGILRPRFFIMENVEGILRSKNAQLLFEALSCLPACYKVLPPLLLKASEFGAATTRRRVAIVGYDPADFPEFSPSDFEAPRNSTPVTVRDALTDIPDPIPQSPDKTNLGWGRYSHDTRHLSAYAIAARSCPPAHLGSPESHLRHQGNEVSGLFVTKHSEEISARYGALAAGKSDPITKSYKLCWNGQCPTLRAGTGAERGAFQAVRPLHPDQGRVITVREAARLQGFPDWFQFHPTKWQSFRMIGNSVSPYVSFGLLSAIALKLQMRVAA
jgi:DNA (cytosine-5)-methyltransferase 1